MTDNRDATTESNTLNAQAPLARVIATNGAWQLAEYICTSGPGDRSFEERHETFTIAAVVEGSFRYRGDSGDALLHAGSLLLGNAGRCFACGHDHSRGDRCIAIHVEPDYFAEVSASCAGAAAYTFATSMLSAASTAVRSVARMQSLASHRDSLAIDNAVTELIERIIATTSGTTPSRETISTRDERRITAALRLLESEFEQPIDLDRLAATAAMSKYHFLRTFRRLTGTTPYRYLISLRLRQVAVRLVTTAAPISELAFEAGFGDLSTFVAQFRRHFGDSPSRYRALHRPRPRL